ncbi:hypothetical protein BJX70DRAFT_385040 [Aspergillus crustosus]
MIKEVQGRPDTEPLKPTCSSADISFPEGGLDTNDVMYKLRSAVCAGDCGTPEDLPDNVSATSAQNEDKSNCLVVAGFKDTDVQAYMYRGSAPEGDQWQTCFDSTADIIKQCVQSDDDNHLGWVNGKDENQFYQGGLSPLNGELPGDLSYTLPAPANTKGTNLHINGDQCIVINADSKRCGSDDPYNIAYEDSETSSVLIYAQFDSNKKDTNKAKSGCKLDASWPSVYEDIYFGEDYSLYDADGNKINDQSCSEAPDDSESDIPNPYYAPSFSSMVAKIQLYYEGSCDGQSQELPVTMARINQDIYLGDAYPAVSLTLLNTDECSVKGCFAGYGCDDQEVKTSEVKLSECTLRASDGPQKDLNFDKLYVTCPNLDAITHS